MKSTQDIVLSNEAIGGEIIPAGDAFPGVIRAAPSEDSLAQALRYRWVTLLLVTLVTGAAGVAGIWFLVEPEYEVAAQIHVRAVVPPIMTGDADTDITRNYVTYIGTQRGIIYSPDLIAVALESPEVANAPPLAMPGDPVRNVMSMLRVERAGNTELLRLSLIGQQPDTLSVILNSIVKTYMKRQEDERRAADELALSSLRSEQAALEARLKVKGEQLRQLAQESGLPGPYENTNPFTSAVVTYQGMLTDARKVRAVAEGKLRAIKTELEKDGAEQVSLPGFGDYAARDPLLLSLKDQLRSLELSSLTDKNFGRGPGHPEVASRPQLQAALRDQIGVREKELRELFLLTEVQRLESEVRDAGITEKVVEAELEKALSERSSMARQEFVLEDVRHEREQLEAALTAVRSQIWRVSVEQNRQPRLTLKSPARAPSEPNIDRRPKYAAAAVFGCFLLGCAVAFLRHRMDTSFRNPTQVSERLGMRVLGAVQQIAKSNGAAQSFDQAMREPVRGISTALLAASGSSTTHSRLITSPSPGSGKSSMAINLARSLAATGRSVLLIDADNHRRGVSRQLDMADLAGLRELLDGTGIESELVRNGENTRLKILPAGKPFERFGELLANREAQARMRQMFARFDEVIVDSPPVLANSHATLLATLVDEVVLVLRAGQSCREEAEAAQRQLATVGSTIVGAILNGVDPRRVPYGYGYGYGFESEYQDTQT